MKNIKIEDLVNRDVSAVCFVLDYLEIHFGGPIVRALGVTRVNIEGCSLKFKDPGFAEIVQSLIGDRVQEVFVREGQEIRITFESSSSLTISLSREERDWYEAAHFVPEPGQPIDVW